MESIIQNGFSVLTIIVALTGNFVQGVPRFTRHPPSVLYLSSGDTARFVWDYKVNNRTTELDPFSTEWSFYTKSGGISAIGMDDGLKGWGFVINKNCPSRLLNPTRVSKESTATLVICNVTTADSEIYGCTLILIKGSPITSKLQLVVTDMIPIFTLISLKISSCPICICTDETMHWRFLVGIFREISGILDRPRFISLISPKNVITERSNLSISCSAAGNPLPNLTWVKIGGHRKIINKGLGSVLLSIVNITRRYSGIYECQARNNPNVAAVTMQTEVSVSWKPSIELINSSTTVVSFDGKKIRLQCKANGQPVPNITWYNPQGLMITKGTNSIHGNSAITIKTTEDRDYGQYQCKASNTAGYDKHVINVTRLFSPESSIVTISKIEVSSVMVTWVSPFCDGGYPIIDYKIQINTKPPREIITENKYQVIKNLMENTTYTVMVYARNIVGYGKVSIVKITTKSQARIDQAEESCYVAFYQGQTFTIIHLSITCVLILANIILIIFICLTVKKKRIKENIASKTQRFFRSAEVPVDKDVISLSRMEPVLTVETTPHVKAQNEDCERISDKSASTSSIENIAQEDNQTEIHLQETQHQYQELNDATLILNKQVYQSLYNTGDVVAQVEPTAVSEQKYEPMKFPDKPQSPEYHKLHLYANIELDKK